MLIISCAGTGKGKKKKLIALGQKQQEDCAEARRQETKKCHGPERNDVGPEVVLGVAAEGAGLCVKYRRREPINPLKVNTKHWETTRGCHCTRNKRI